MWKFIISAGLALGTGWWTNYLFEPASTVASRVLYLVPALLFGFGYLYDLARKRTSVLPPVLRKLVKLERRSLQDVLGRLSKEERLELGRIFAGADGAQTRMNIYRKRGHTSRLRIVLHFLLLNLALGLLLLSVHALGVWFFLPDKQEIKEIAQLVQMHLKKTETGELEFGGAINDLYASGERISPHV
ncbi:MAG: hypothetical protein GY801_09890, partial [bacterium]|nr:hypothetical protein [bacterium]